MENLKHTRLLVFFTALCMSIIAIVVVAKQVKVTSSLQEMIEQGAVPMFDLLNNNKKASQTAKEPNIAQKKEHRTVDKITEDLSSLDLGTETGIGGYGVLGCLKGHRMGRRTMGQFLSDSLSREFPDLVELEYYAKWEDSPRNYGKALQGTVAFSTISFSTPDRKNLSDSALIVFYPFGQDMLKPVFKMKPGLRGYELLP